MSEFWKTAFSKMQLAWGMEPTASALLARDYFARAGAKDVLIPGIGYGRNAKPFLECGMSVTGIEISETAIGLARSKLGLEFPIHHGSVTDMPFDQRQYGHTPDKVRAMQESLARLAAQGVRAIED